MPEPKEGPPDEFQYATASGSRLVTRFASHAMAYGLLTLLTRVGSFLLLPVYWRYIEPEGFGVLGMTELVSWLLLPVVTLSLEGAALRFYFEWPEADRRRNLGSLWGLFLTWSTVAVGCVALAGYWLWPLAIRKVPFWPFVPIALGTLFFQSLVQIPLALLRIREKAGLYVLYNLLIFVLSATVSLWLVIVEKLGILGVLSGGLVGYAVVGVIGALALTLHAPPNTAWRGIRPATAYAFSVLPAAVLFAFPRVFDRFFLDKVATLADVGFYSLGNSFGSVVSNAQTTLKTAWVPTAFRLGIEREDGPRIIGKLGKYYVAGLLAIALAVALLSREFVLLAGADKYAPVIDFAPVFALVAFLGTFDVLSFTGFSLAKRTSQDIWIGFFQLALGAGLIGALTVAYGSRGAIVGLLGTRAVTVLVRFSLSLSICRIPYELGRLGAAMFLAFGAYAAGFVSHGWGLAAAIGWKLALLAAWTGVTGFWILGGLAEARSLAGLRRAPGVAAGHGLGENDPA